MHELQWVRAVDQVNFKVATHVYCFLHDLTPPDPHGVVDVDSRRRSANTNVFLILWSRLVTFGDRLFPVAAPLTWNSLLKKVRLALLLFSFKRQLVTPNIHEC